MPFVIDSMEQSELPKSIYKQKIFHLDVPPYHPYEPSVYLDKDFEKQHLQEDRQQLRKIIESRLRNNQSLDLPINAPTRYGKVRQLGNYCGMNIDFTQNFFTPLKVAARSDFFLDITQFLLTRGADPNYKHKKLTALQVAVLYGCTKTVQVLLNAGAVCKDQLLLHACPPEKHELFSVLLTYGTDPNELWKCMRNSLGCSIEDSNSLLCLFSKLKNLYARYTLEPSQFVNIVKSALYLLAAGVNPNYYQNGKNLMLENISLIRLPKSPDDVRRNLLLALKQHGVWKGSSIDNGLDGLIEEVFADEKEKLLQVSRDKTSYLNVISGDVFKQVVDIYRQS